MENNYDIRIGYSNKHHVILISEFKSDLPQEVKFSSYLQDRYYSADGEFYQIVITLSEWLLSNSGSYFLNLVLDKMRVLLKQHSVLYKNKASFEIVIGKGSKTKSFKASNVSESDAMKAFDEFVNIVKNIKS